MIINNLLIKLKERDNIKVKQARDALLSMNGKIETLCDLQVKLDIRHEASSYDILLITYFSSMEDMKAYLVHPVHVEVANYIAGVMASGASVCYEE